MNKIKWLAALSLSLIIPIVMIGSGCSCQSSEPPGVEIIGWSCIHSSNPIAYCQSELNEEQGRFTFTIYNTYPGYQCEVTLFLENTGEGAGEITDIQIGPDSSVTVGEITVEVNAPGLPYTLNPGETVDVIFTVSVHDNAAQNAQYGIQGSIEVHVVEEE